jgi:hypothetical protein
MSSKPQSNFLLWLYDRLSAQHPNGLIPRMSAAETESHYKQFRQEHEVHERRAALHVIHGGRTT